MYKFIVQEDDLDLVVEKLEALAKRLKVNNTVTKVRAPKVVEEIVEEEEYVDEAEISTYSEPKVHPSLAQNAPALKKSSVVDMNNLDAAGVPWIKGIHAATKTKVKDGTWKIARGVDDVTANAAMAPYKRVTSNGNQPTQTPPNSGVQQNITTTAQPYNQSGPAYTQQVQPAVAQPAMPGMQQGHTLQSFSANFPYVIATLLTAGKINQEYVQALEDHFKIGRNNLWQLDEASKAVTFETFVNAGIVQRVG